jgi:hypothetical protein
VVLQPGAGVLVIDLHGGSEASIKEGPGGRGGGEGQREKADRQAGRQAGSQAGSQAEGGGVYVVLYVPRTLAVWLDARMREPRGCGRPRPRRRLRGSWW